MSIEEIYEPVNGALHNAGALMDASETHGVLCGLLCLLESAEADFDSTWFKQVLGEAGSDELVADIQKQLQLLKTLTVQQLESPLSEFAPLLPDDEEILATRIQGIGGWSSGFLYGLGLGHLDETQLSAEAQEFIQDVVHLSRIAPDSDDDDNAEHNYMQLVEYLRVGVLNLYEECRVLNKVTMH